MGGRPRHTRLRSRAADPSKIKGNFTHEEFPESGYSLPIAVGMGNDYWGYVPEYREYRAHDHYRKALSGLGPHGADFLATRLSRLAAELNGGPGPEIRPIDLAFQAESARAEAMALGLGELAHAYEQVYQAQLPADGGTPEITAQPETVELFSGAHLEWTGGSTYADIPSVIVQREVDGEWVPYADTTGEIQVIADLPAPDEFQTWRSGEYEWKWTAVFEAFGSDIAQPDAAGQTRDQTPPGKYRFVVEGQRRTGTPATLEDYSLESEPFAVVGWDGITVEDARVDGDAFSFAVGPAPVKSYPYLDGTVGPIDVPDSYDTPFSLIDNERRTFTYGLEDQSRHQVYCSFCSFRPWADTSKVSNVTVTIERADGSVEQVGVSQIEGRWVASAPLYAGDIAYVGRGGIVDNFGNINGDPSARVEGTEPRPEDDSL